MRSSRYTLQLLPSPCLPSTSRLTVEAAKSRWAASDGSTSSQCRSISSSASSRDGRPPKEAYQRRPTLRDGHARPSSLSRKAAEAVATRRTDTKATSASPLARISLSSDEIPFEHDNSDGQPLITLKNGLDRVLFEPGYHWLKDPETGKYNFDERLAVLPRPEEVFTELLERYLKPSLDEILHNKATSSGKRFVGSTSSLTALVNRCMTSFAGDYARCRYDGLSEAYANFHSLPAQRPPFSAQCTYKDGVYAIDPISNNSPDQHTPFPTEAKRNSPDLLSRMGTVGEAWVTLTPEEFDACRKSAISPDAERLRDIIARRSQAFRYAPVHDMYCRSQIDGGHLDLPRKAIDIKSRSVLPLRYDLLNYASGLAYSLDRVEGLKNSVEREIFDMIRTTYLNWSIQARIGGMDGIFTMFHNTRDVFGFQYNKLADLDRAVMTSSEAAESSFRVGLGLANALFNAVADHFAGQDFCLYAPGVRPRDLVRTRAELTVIGVPGRHRHTEEGARDDEGVIGYTLRHRRSDFSASRSVWKVESDLYPLSTNEVQGHLAEHRQTLLTTLANRSLTLPPDVAELLTAEDHAVIMAHNARQPPSVEMEGTKHDGTRYRVAGGLYPLDVGQTYRTAPSMLQRMLRKQGTISPSQILRQWSPPPLHRGGPETTRSRP